MSNSTYPLQFRAFLRKAVHSGAGGSPRCASASSSSQSCSCEDLLVLTPSDLHLLIRGRVHPPSLAVARCGALDGDEFTRCGGDFGCEEFEDASSVIRMKPVTPYSSVIPASSSAHCCGSPTSRERPDRANCPEIFGNRRTSDGSRPTETAPSSICLFISSRAIDPSGKYWRDGSHPSAICPVDFSIRGL